MTLQRSLPGDKTPRGACESIARQVSSRAVWRDTHGETAIVLPRNLAALDGTTSSGFDSRHASEEKGGDMLICYELAIPRVNTWNGRWSGEGNLYARVRSYGKPEGERILSKSQYGYRWDDGWAARVSVRRVTAQEAKRIRRKSKGFLNYDWMIDSIERFGKIEPPSAQKGDRSVAALGA